jgi:hypothetical protein
VVLLWLLARPVPDREPVALGLVNGHRDAPSGHDRPSRAG